MWNFCKSHYVQSEPGQIFSFGDFDIDTGAVKQAKNRPKMTLDGQNRQYINQIIVIQHFQTILIKSSQN